MRNFTASVCQLLANTLYQECSRGASLNLDFDSPKAGYMVSVLAGPVYASKADVSPIEVAQFYKKNWETYQTNDHASFAGVWTDLKTGEIYFDIAYQFDDKEGALLLADNLNEIAIYDVVNDSEIRL